MSVGGPLSSGSLGAAVAKWYICSKHKKTGSENLRKKKTDDTVFNQRSVTGGPGAAAGAIKKTPILRIAGERIDAKGAGRRTDRGRASFLGAEHWQV